jgi:hypothetical protein
MMNEGHRRMRISGQPPSWSILRNKANFWELSVGKLAGCFHRLDHVPFFNFFFNRRSPFSSMNSTPAAGDPPRTGGSFDVVGFWSEFKRSSSPYFQSDPDLSVVVFSEVNAGLLKGFLYFEDGREVSFHDALVLFDAL